MKAKTWMRYIGDCNACPLLVTGSSFNLFNNNTEINIIYSAFWWKQKREWALSVIALHAFYSRYLKWSIYYIKNYIERLTGIISNITIKLTILLSHNVRKVNINEINVQCSSFVPFASKVHYPSCVFVWSPRAGNDVTIYPNFKSFLGWKMEIWYCITLAHALKTIRIRGYSSISLLLSLSYNFIHMLTLEISP